MKKSSMIHLVFFIFQITPALAKQIIAGVEVSASQINVRSIMKNNSQLVSIFPVKYRKKYFVSAFNTEKKACQLIIKRADMICHFLGQGRAAAADLELGNSRKDYQILPGKTMISDNNLKGPSSSFRRIACNPTNVKPVYGKFGSCKRK